MGIVEQQTDAHAGARAPLLILETVRSFLDEHGLGSGPLQAHRIGEGGGSNFSFLLERDDGQRDPNGRGQTLDVRDVTTEAGVRSRRDNRGWGQTLAVRDVTTEAGVRPLPFEA